jgi:alkanesulfonate monooxygenase SsuD/methylene tetrahydromethanopterin reductase-like flavin-dependent oxidoreductase (luciferase family)
MSSSKHSFHTSIVHGGAPDGAALAAVAKRAESLGYDALVMPDAPGFAPSVFPGLTWVAANTTRLQVGTHVLNNELRHPLNVAREAATLQGLSGGRFILGMGTGRDRDGADIRPFGIQVDPPGKRVSRLEASTAIITDLFAGKSVTTAGPDYFLDGAELKVPLGDQPAPTMLIAAGGPRMLAFAGRTADVVALGLDPMTPFAKVQECCEIVRNAATAVGRSPEIGFSISGAGDVIHPWLKARLGDQLNEEALADVPAFLMGDQEAMRAKLDRIREFGISRIFIDTGLMDVLAPVLLDGTRK